MKRSVSESLLIDELRRLGAIVYPQFRIPGTNSRVDIYIAFPVRAFVEIKNLELPTRTDAERLRLQLEHYSQLFGDKIVPVLVVGASMISPILDELRNTGFSVVAPQDSPVDPSVAKQTARLIWQHLIQLPYRFESTAVAESPVYYDRDASAPRSRRPKNMALAREIGQVQR